MKTLPILSYNNLADESDKLVLNTFARYNLSHESPPFSIDDLKDVTINLINVSTAVQSPKYNDCPNKSDT